VIYGILAALALIGVFGWWMHSLGKKSQENKYNKLSLKAVDEYGKSVSKINRISKSDYTRNDILSGNVLNDSKTPKT